MKIRYFVSFLVSIFFLCSCSTYHTVTKFRPNSPKVFSGTRLNLHSIKKDGHVLRVYREAYGLEPREHPYLDFPLSLFMDIALFPLTMGVAGSDMAFDRVLNGL